MPDNQSVSEELVYLVRGCVRPICTVIGLISCIVLYAGGLDVPNWLLLFTGGMLSFWFGEKFLKNLVLK